MKKKIIVIIIDIDWNEKKIIAIIIDIFFGHIAQP